MRSTHFTRLLMAGVLALSCLARAAAAPPPAMPAGPKPPPFLPGHPNIVLVSPCIPGMGYHYADPKTLPYGPIYGWYNGKWTFTEVMPNVQQFAVAHQSWDDQLKPLAGYAIDHVDIWYEKNGHPGYWAPHYDIHAFYVPHKEHMFWCGNTTGKRMEFSQGPHGQVIMTPYQGQHR